jgi:hypothetical protein
MKTATTMNWMKQFLGFVMMALALSFSFNALAQCEGKLWSLKISGPTYICEGDTVQYFAMARYIRPACYANVTDEAHWSTNCPPNVLKPLPKPGKFRAGNVYKTTWCRIYANYTEEWTSKKDKTFVIKKQSIKRVKILDSSHRKCR